MAILIKRKVRGLETETVDVTEIARTTRWWDWAARDFDPASEDLFLTRGSRQVSTVNLGREISIFDAVSEATPAGEPVEGVYVSDRTAAATGAGK